MLHRWRDLVVCVALAGAVPVAQAGDAGFDAFLAEVEAAQVEFVQGRPAAFQALWARDADVSLFGGFGSGESGPEKVQARLAWASSQFSKGTRTHEVVSRHVEGGVGYVVQRETIRYTVPGQSREATLELRATIVMRRGPQGWRVVHRHADSQVTKQAP